MVEVGILNRDIADAMSYLGHMDEMIIADAGFPLPPGVRTIDISLANNKPLVTEFLEELLKYFSIEKIILAEEAKEKSPSHFNKVTGMCKDAEVETISHAEFKKRSRNVKVIIRTGDFTAWGNVLLVSGSGDRWYREKS
jgi:D-ribose pyranase